MDRTSDSPRSPGNGFSLLRACVSVERGHVSSRSDPVCTARKHTSSLRDPLSAPSESSLSQRNAEGIGDDA